MKIRWPVLGGWCGVAVAVMSVAAWAQAPAAAPGAAAGVAAPAAAAAVTSLEGAAPVAQKPNMFIEMIFGCGPWHAVAWFALFFVSVAVLAFVIDGILTIKKSKLIPPDVISGVREALSRGDLGAATAACEVSPSPVSRILLTALGNIQEGYEVIQETVTSSAEMESEKLMQRVNYLSICGQIGPMLGLLGTTLGMVRAFASLGEAAGAAKASMLAVAISTAMWTTVMGLGIAIPALISFVLLRNHTARLILEMQATVLDLIKVLRTAEVVEQ